MAHTVFVDGVTVSAASWFNDIDAVAYTGVFPTGPTAVSVTGATTLAVFNTIATTINAFGAASVALNIGHASAAAAFAGGISIPTGKNVTGAGTATVIGFQVGSFGTSGNQGSVKILGSTSGTATFSTDATVTKLTLDKPLDLGSNSLTSGAITGTTGAFSGTIASTKDGNVFNATGSTTGPNWFSSSNTSGAMLVGIESSTGASLFTGSTAYATVFGTSANKPVQIASNNAVVASFSSTGLSITAANGIILSLNSSLTDVAGRRNWGLYSESTLGGLGLWVSASRGAAPSIAVAEFSSTGLTVIGDFLSTTMRATSNGAVGTALDSTTGLNIVACSTANSSIRLLHGTAPTSPVNGDIWTTTGGMFVRINGVTKSVNLT